MYIVYKITNLITNEYYIGVHKMIKKIDNYYGSGIRIKSSIKKYGLDNFREEALFIFETSKEAFDTEKEILKIHLNKEKCLNLAEGGKGGATRIGNKLSKETKEKIRKKAIGRKYSKETNKKKGNWSRGKTYQEIYGDRAKLEKQKRSEAHQGKILTSQHKENIRKSMLKLN